MPYGFNDDKSQYDINTDPVFITRTYSKTISVNVNATVILDIDTIAGYTPIGIARWWTGSQALTLYGVSESFSRLYIRNVTSTAVNNVDTNATILYVRSDLIGA